MKFKYLLSFLFLSKNIAEIAEFGLGQNVSFGGIIHYNLSDSWSGGLIGEYNILSNLVNPFFPKDISRTRNKDFVSVGLSFLKTLDEKMIDSVLCGVNVGISRDLINYNFFHLNLKTVEAFLNLNFFSLLHLSFAIGIFNLRYSLKKARDDSDYKVYFKIGGGGFISHSVEKVTFGAKFTFAGKVNLLCIKEKSDYLKAQYNRLKKDEIDSLVKHVFDIERKKLLNEKRRNCKCSELTEDKKKEIINKIFTKKCKCSELTEDEEKEIINKIYNGINNKDLCINGVPLYALSKSCFFKDFELFFNSSSIKSDINESVLMKLVPDENIRQTLEDLMLSFNLDELIYTSDKIDSGVAAIDTGTVEEVVNQETVDVEATGDVVGNAEIDAVAVVSTIDTEIVDAAAGNESKKEMILKKENSEIDKKIIKFILDEKENFNNWMKIADFMKEDIINEKIINSNICLSAYTRCLIDGYKNLPENVCDDDKIYIRNLTFLHLYKDIMKHVKTSTVFGKSEDFHNFMLSNGCLDFSISDIS